MATKSRKGRTASGRLKKGYKLTRRGVVKARPARRPRTRR
jgi:hypothetical protein